MCRYIQRMTYKFATIPCFARFGGKKSDIRIIKIHLSRLASKRCCSFYGPFTVEKKGIDNF